MTRQKRLRTRPDTHGLSAFGGDGSEIFETNQENFHFDTVPLDNPERSDLFMLAFIPSYSMPTSRLALLVILRSLIRSRIDLQLENLALRQQIGVLQRSLKKHPN